MSNERQTGHQAPRLDRPGASGPRPTPRKPAHSEIVPVSHEDDPLVRALVGGDRDSAPPAEEPRELSPESLAILLDRLDGMVEANEAASQPPAASGAPARPGDGRRKLGPRLWLSVAALLLATGVALLLWPQGPAREGRVEGHTTRTWEPGVRRVELPAAPEQAPPAREAPTAGRSSIPSNDAVGGQAQPSAGTPNAAPAVVRGSVRVERESGPAEVFLRGRSLGRIPGTFELRPGRHHLLFRMPDGLSFYRTVRVTAGQRTELELP